MLSSSPLRTSLNLQEEKWMRRLISRQNKVRYGNRELQLIQYNVRLIHHNAQLNQYRENKRRILDCHAEVKKGGVLQRIEAKAGRLFRTKQIEELAEIRRLQIERAVKEQGTECFITSPAGLVDV